METKWPSLLIQLNWHSVISFTLSLTTFTAAVIPQLIQHFINIPLASTNTMASSTKLPSTYTNHSFFFIFLTIPYLLIYHVDLFIYFQFVFILLLFSVVRVRKFKELHVLVLRLTGITSRFSKLLETLFLFSYALQVTGLIGSFITLMENLMTLYFLFRNYLALFLTHHNLSINVNS